MKRILILILPFLLAFAPFCAFAVDEKEAEKVKKMLESCIQQETPKAKSKAIARQVVFMCLSKIGAQMGSLEELGSTSNFEFTETDRQGTLKGLSCYFQNLPHYNTLQAASISLSSCNLIHLGDSYLIKKYTTISAEQNKDSRVFAHCFLENLGQIQTEIHTTFLVDQCSKKAPLAREAYKIGLVQDLEEMKTTGKTEQEKQIMQAMIQSLQMQETINLF